MLALSKYISIKTRTATVDSPRHIEKVKSKEGWGDSLVGNMLALRIQDVSLICRTPLKSQAWWGAFMILVLNGVRIPEACWPTSLPKLVRFRLSLEK